MKSKALVFWVAVLFVFTGVTACWLGWRSANRVNAVEQSSGPGADAQEALDGDDSSNAKVLLTQFTLTDQRGKKFHSQDMQGKVWIASFFYASCPQVCRMQNIQVANLQRDYAGQDVEFVSITCDPERDTPGALSEYARLFSADPNRWHFLTGDFDYIKRIGGEMMKVTVEKEVHSERLIVLDRGGEIRGAFMATDPQQMAELKKCVDAILADDAS
jgi:cytochrome oxidase Cu insertion factor (SCO1/SenC/PrrC family)